MPRLGDDGSEVAQAMHDFDVDMDVRHVVKQVVDVGGHLAGRERCSAPVIDVDPVRCPLG